MLKVKLITVGSLKEAYWRDAFAEYQKRLSGLCAFEEINLKEKRLSDRPSPKEIDDVLTDEGNEILSHLSAKAYVIALCVEGQMLSSEKLAQKLDEVATRCGEVDLIIGSSFGLADAVKRRADFKLSFSPMTFPHQLMRVVLMEQIYRAFQIQKGSSYHK